MRLRTPPLKPCYALLAIGLLGIYGEFSDAGVLGDTVASWAALAFCSSNSFFATIE